MLMEDIEVEVYRSTVKIPAIFFVPATGLLTVYVLVYLLLNSNIFIDQLQVQLDRNLPGEFQVKEIVTDPSLTTFRIVEPYVGTKDGAPIIRGGSIVAGINPLMFLVKRVQVSHAKLDGSWVHLELDENSDLNLLKALGAVDDSEDDKPSPFTPKIGLYNLSTEDCYFVFDMEDLHFEVPDVDIPHAEIDIINGSATILVPELKVDRAPFHFSHNMFSLSEEWGDWKPVARNVHIENWQWVNDGFFVENVHIEVDRTVLDAEGSMNFPDHENEDKEMTYRASGRLESAYGSWAPRYFLQGYTHIGARRIDLDVEGDLGDVVLYGKYDIARIDGYGLQIDDASGTFHLENENVFLGRSTATVHGGDVVVSQAFYDMYTGVFGVTTEFKNLNPEPVVRDIGFEYPYLDGTASGAFEAFGYIPYEREVADDLEHLAGFEDAVRPIVDVRLTKDLVYKRRSTDILPGQNFRVSKGTRVWSQEDRVGVPYAVIRSEFGEFTFRDFVLNYDTYELEPTLDGRLVQVLVETDDVGGMVRYYGGAGISGPLALSVTGSGRLNYPDVQYDLSMESPAFDIAGIEWKGSNLTSKGEIKSGTLFLDSLALRGDEGEADISGSLAVLRSPSGVLDDDGEITTDYLYPSSHPMDLAVDVRDLDLRNITTAFGTSVELEGLVSANGALIGTLENPEGEIVAQTKNAIAFEQPIKSASARLSFAGESFGIKDADIDLASAGRISGDANFIGEEMTFRAKGAGLELGNWRPVQEAVPVTGRGNFSLHGTGTFDQPNVGGYIRVDNLRIDKRKIGDLAVVANTISDTVHLSGAVLPWVTVDAEIPFADDQAYYARLGIDHVDLTDAIRELRDLQFISGSTATGTVELFVEKDFSRYQVLANLSEIELKTLGKRFKNKGPVIAGLNEERLLQIQQAQIGADNKYVSVQGGVFLDQSLIDLSVVGDLDLSLLDGMRVAFSDYFPESFLEADGLAAVNATIKGPPDAIIAEGDIKFSPSEILLRDFSDPLVILSGTIELDREAMRIESRNPIRGRILGGLFSVTGSMGLKGMDPSNLVANVWAQNLSYRVPDVADVTFGTELELRAPDFSRPDTWLVSGDVQIVDGLYYENFSIFQEQLTNRLLGTFTQKTEQYESSIIERFPQLEEIGWNVDINARDGFRIKNEIDRLGLNLELRVAVNVRSTLINPTVTGQIDVVGGSVAFQGERFDVRSGTLSFNGDAANPFVDVVADAEVHNACRDPEISNEASQTMTLSGVADSGQQQTFNIILNVRGRFENLDIQFESTPYADQRDILSLLLTGCTVDQLTASSASSPTLEVALGPVLGWIEGQVQDAVKVEEFTITPSVDRLKATVGDSITRRLSWRFQLDTGLTESAGGQLGQLVYKLSDQWSAQLSESISDSALSEEQNFLIEFKLKYRLLID